MRSDLTWLLLGVYLCVGTSVGLIAFCVSDVREHAFIQKWIRSYSARLRAVRAPLTAEQLLVWSTGIALFSLGLFPWIGFPVVLLSLVLVYISPRIALGIAWEKRVAQVELQVEPWLGAIANALRASSSLGEAISGSASLVAAPMSQEVAVLVREYELGTPLDQALQRLSDRIPSRALSGAVQALSIARRTGGNLAETLENAASALRELARLEGVVRTKTAEGKAQAWVIGAVPFPMFFGIRAIDHQYFEPLLSSQLGSVLLGCAAVLWVAAIVLANKILSVDV